MSKPTDNNLICKICVYVLIFLAGSIIAADGKALAQGQISGDVNFFLGYKNLDEDDWEPLDQHIEFGVDFDIKQVNWPVSIVAGFLSSSDDDTGLINIGGTIYTTDIEAQTTELYLGARKIFDVNPTVRPFVGGGLTLVSAELEASISGVSVSDDDSAIGFWVGGGVYLTLAEHLNLGVNLMYSNAEVTLFDVDVEGGGFHYGAFIGYHW